jgi:hypothetical protein
LRGQANFVSGIKLICPVQSLPENIPLVPSGKSAALIRASRAERGALANVINAARDAMDAEARFDEAC